VLIINESSIGAFLHSALLQLYPCYYGMHIIFSHTCWVPTISVLNLAKLLLRSWRRIGVFRWGVLGERLPRSIAYGVLVFFHCYVSTVFDLIFCERHYSIINIIYCDIGYSVSIFCMVCVETCSWAHILWEFGLTLRLGVTEWYQSCVDHMSASLVRRVLPLVLFW
jgi:hypothetical protein